MLKRQAKQGAAGIQHDICEPQTIGLVGTQPNDSMQDTFQHEVFHAIVHVMDLKETETEENYVRRLATGLCTVWNNNPAAFKWWPARGSQSSRIRSVPASKRAFSS